MIGFAELIKHKYKSRKPDGKGGWRYEYDQPASASKRATAEHLPESPWRYFKNVPGAKLIPLSKLTPTRAREKGIANAGKYMALAYNGEMEARKPISLKDNGDGTYSVLDGNSTYANAMRNGWAQIPAIIEKSQGRDLLRERLSKRLSGAPAGFGPIPNGTRGGYRKRQGKGWIYWYPETGGASKPAADGGQVGPGGITWDSGQAPEAVLRTLAEHLGGIDEVLKDYKGEEPPASPIYTAIVPSEPKRLRGVWAKAALKMANLMGVGSSPVEAMMEEKTWRNNSGGQAIETPEALHALAKSCEKPWIAAVRSIATAAGGDANFGPGDAFAVKGLGGIKRKTAKKMADRGVDQATVLQGGLGDAVRATILADRAQDVGAAVRKAQAHFEAMGGKMIVDNKFHPPPNSTGYVGVHADVLFPAPGGGMIKAELQFHPKAINSGDRKCVKEQSHALYEKSRGGESAAVKARYDSAQMMLFTAGMLNTLAASK